MMTIPWAQKSVHIFLWDFNMTDFFCTLNVNIGVAIKMILVQFVNHLARMRRFIIKSSAIGKLKPGQWFFSGCSDPACRSVVPQRWPSRCLVSGCLGRRDISSHERPCLGWAPRGWLGMRQAPSGGHSVLMMMMWKVQTLSSLRSVPTTSGTTCRHSTNWAYLALCWRSPNLSIRGSSHLISNT